MTISTLLRYPGGKSRAVSSLRPLVPESVTTVCAPFFGGGSFELDLIKRGVTVQGFDGFKHLVNFWEHALNHPGALMEMLHPMVGTINSEIFRSYQKELIVSAECVLKELPEERLKYAALFFVVNRCSFSGSTLSGGYSKAAGVGRFTTSSVNRIEGVSGIPLTVEYYEVNTQLPVTSQTEFLFLDPPYYLGKARNKLYGVSGDLHSNFNHQGLHQAVVDSGLPFLLTYNDCPYIRDLWSDYDIKTAEWSYGMNSSKKSSEIIIQG